MSLINSLIKVYKTGQRRAIINSTKIRFQETVMPDDIIKKSAEIEQITQNYGFFKKRIYNLGYIIENRKRERV